jgi:hypothetical protein
MPISYADFQQRRRNLVDLGLDRARRLREYLKPIVDEGIEDRTDPEPITGQPMFAVIIEERADPAAIGQSAPPIVHRITVRAFDGSTLAFSVGTLENAFLISGLVAGHDIFPDAPTHKWVTLNGTLRKLDTIEFVAGSNKVKVYDLLNGFEEALYNAHPGAGG